MITTHGWMTAYLAAYVFCMQISLGGLAVFLIHRLTGGEWGNVLAPFLRANLFTFYFLALGFLPIALNLSGLYIWAAHPIVDPQQPLRGSFFLNPEFFLVRTFVYLAIWNTIAFFSRSTNSKSKLFSGLSLVALLFTVSFAGCDWLMTLDPDWTSTGFGAVFIAGSLSNAFAFFTLLLFSKLVSGYVSGHVSGHASGRIEDLRIKTKNPLGVDFGNLLLMATLLWVYMDFMQYLVVWSGHLPKEMHWYDARTTGPWFLVFIGVAFFHFLLPFPLLLFRDNKTRRPVMKTICLSLLIGQFLEVLLWTLPPTHSQAALLIFAGTGMTALFGAVWFFNFHFLLKRDQPAFSGPLRVRAPGGWING